MKNDIMLTCLLLGLILGVGIIIPFKKPIDVFHIASTTAFQAGKSAPLSGVVINKTYGGTDTDQADALLQTADGGYALAGSTASYGAGFSDFWLVKTDANGNKKWDKTYGGTDDESAYSLLQTTDERYALAGYTKSFDAGRWGMGDMWLVVTTSNESLMPSSTASGFLLGLSLCCLSIIIYFRKKRQRS